MESPVPQRRIRVDSRLCEGHALCIDLSPEVFNLSDDDVATCTEHPPETSWGNVLAAVDACPRGAISVIGTSDRKDDER